MPSTNSETASDQVTINESCLSSNPDSLPYDNPFLDSSALFVPSHKPKKMSRRVSCSGSELVKTPKHALDGVTEAVVRTRSRLRRRVCVTDPITNGSNSNVPNKKTEEGYNTVSVESESENSNDDSCFKIQTHHDKVWMEMFQRLVAYKEKHNTTKVPYNYEKDVQLRNWVHCQRQNCKREDRRAKLDSIDFEWKATKYRNWDQMFQSLIEFKEDHGHTRVPLKYEVDPLLGSWVKRQRVRCHRQDRIDRLNSIGFQWRVLKRYDWDEMYSRLLKFKAKHNSVKVPRGYIEDPELATWVRHQRPDCMPKRKKDLLDKIGFKWAVCKGDEWNMMYERLVEYSKKYHTTCVPSNYEDARLEKWVRTQRLTCKREDRVKRLNDIGFVWSSNLVTDNQ